MRELKCISKFICASPRPRLVQNGKSYVSMALTAFAAWNREGSLLGRHIPQYRGGGEFENRKTRRTAIRAIIGPQPHSLFFAQHDRYLFSPLLRMRLRYHEGCRDQSECGYQRKTAFRWSAIGGERSRFCSCVHFPVPPFLLRSREVYLTAAPPIISRWSDGQPTLVQAAFGGWIRWKSRPQHQKKTLIGGNSFDRLTGRHHLYRLPSARYADRTKSHMRAREQPSLR